MAWETLTNFDRTINSNPGFPWVGAPYTNPAFPNMLTGEYYLRFQGTIYKDSNDSRHYRLNFNMYGSPMYDSNGGYWRRNDGYGVVVEFNGNDIWSGQVNLPLSIFQIPEDNNRHIVSGDFDFYIDRSGTLAIKVQCYCPGAGRSNSSVRINGRLGTSSDGFSGTYSNFIDYEIPDPYSPPSYDIFKATEIIRVDRDGVKVDYKINGGTNNLDWVIARVDGVHDYSAGTGKGDNLSTTFYPKYSEGFKDASQYRVAIRFSDSQAEYQTGWKTFYTYQEPKLSGITADKSTVNANTQEIKFTMTGINDRKWTSYEDKFYTEAHCTLNGSNVGNGWTKVGTDGNVNNFTLSGNTLRSFVPKSCDGQKVVLHVRRWNKRADWVSAEKTVEFTVYYRPRKGVTCSNITYRKNSSSGTALGKGSLLINDDSLTGVYLSWVYDTTTADAGYTQGYRIRLYNTSGTIVKTYYTTNKSYTIPKADIPKMQHTYIDVTPYFGNDQSNLANSANANSYWYFNSPERCSFLVMAAQLKKPKIEYPVHNSRWINHRFRVCWVLPEDPDKGSELETYHYMDVELKINNTVFRMSDDSTIFTTNTAGLTYQRKMVAAPCLSSSFKEASTYSISVRVRKKYTEEHTNWSPWSDTTVIYIEPAVYKVNRGDLILASHYNKSKEVIDRVKNTYGVKWTPSAPPNVIAKETKILRSQYPYANWYDRIVAVKTTVNNYGPYDSGKEKVKFDISNALLANFTAVVELVTAAHNEYVSDGSGRNYMGIVYDRCNRLI